MVDDAIVVVENVERLMHEKQLTAKQASIESMQEISGALIGITLVLTAVFIPMAFLVARPGVIYRQFSITLVSAMALSGRADSNPCLMCTDFKAQSTTGQMGAVV